MCIYKESLFHIVGLDMIGTPAILRQFIIEKNFTSSVNHWNNSIIVTISASLIVEDSR